VVDRREWSFRGRRSYYISVELSDLGEKRVVPVDEAFPVRLDGNMEIGDKIIVWYLKKFKVCAYDRSKSIKEGLEIVLVIAACVIGPIIFSVIFS
ncbi:MAG: hypothetical protein K2N71_04085, partial [Oscillospiraceae bacterium]|nr:hypothetical protein [Oscillospiraceae bacterium]